MKLNGITVALLCSAISTYLAYSETEVAQELATLGIALGNADTEAEQLAVWRKIEIVARWKTP